MEKDQLEKLRHDKDYIYELINEIKSDKLKKWIAHELYTYAFRAKFYKRIFWICFWISLFFPVITSALQLGEGTIYRVFAALLMGSVTAATGLTNGLKAREKWEHYRKFCEKMKIEIVKCQNKIGKYNGAQDPEMILANVLKKMAKKEGKQWQKIKQNLPKQTESKEENETEDKKDKT